MKKRLWTSIVVFLLLLIILSSIVAAPPPPPPPPPPPDFDEEAAGAAQPAPAAPADTTSGGGSTGGSTSRGGGVPGKDYSYKIPSTTQPPPSYTSPQPTYPQQPSVPSAQYTPPYTPPIEDLPSEEGFVEEKAWDPLMIAVTASGVANVVLLCAAVWLFLKRKNAPVSTAVPESIKLYINSNLKNGYPISKIRDALLSSGWSPQQIQEAAMAVQRGQIR